MLQFLLNVSLGLFINKLNKILIIKELQSYKKQAPKFGGNNRSVTMSLPRTWNDGNNCSFPPTFPSENTMIW